MDRLDNCVRCRRQEAVDQVRAGDRLRLGAARSPLNSVQIPPKANSGRSSFSANQTTSFFFVSGFLDDLMNRRQPRATDLEILDHCFR